MNAAGIITQASRIAARAIRAAGQGITAATAAYTGSENKRYAASKTTRLGEKWSPVTRDINTIVNSQSATIRARVQQLCRDFPYFKRGCDVVVNYTVGKGVSYQPRIKSPGGKLVKKLNQQLEDAWLYWGDEVDLAGKQHYHDMERLAKRQDIEGGEFLCVLTRDNSANRFLPVALRLFEGDWLTSSNAKTEGDVALWDAASGISPLSGTGRAVFNGIEYEIASGKVLAYHLADPGSYKNPVRVPAQYVAHGHEVMRPNQMRGISPFATAILIAHSIHELMGSELDKAQMASKWLAFITTPNPGGFQALRGTNSVTRDDGSAKKIEEIDNAAHEYLRPGEDVKFATPNLPGSNFEAFIKLVLRMVAITIGVSYDILSGDYSDLSYTTQRGSRNDMIEAFEPVRGRHIFQFSKKVQHWFLDAAYLTGKIQMPDYIENPGRYMRAYWQPAGHRMLDPLRESKANSNDLKSLLRSPQEICRERGRDFEDVLSDIAEAKAQAKGLGIDYFELLGMVNTALANNPAAVAGGEGEAGGGQKGVKKIWTVK